MTIRPDTRIEIAQRLHKDMQPGNITCAMLQDLAKNVAHTNYEDPLGRIFETSASLMHHDGVTINIRLEVLLPGWQEEKGYWAERAEPEEQEAMSLRDEIHRIIEDAIADTGEQVPDIGNAPERVIAAVREALLSDEALDAAWDALETAGPKATNGMVVRRMAYAALDAIMKEPK